MDEGERNWTFGWQLKEDRRIATKAKRAQRQLKQKERLMATRADGLSRLGALVKELGECMAPRAARKAVMALCGKKRHTIELKSRVIVGSVLKSGGLRWQPSPSEFIGGLEGLNRQGCEKARGEFDHPDGISEAGGQKREVRCARDPETNLQGQRIFWESPLLGRPGKYASVLISNFEKFIWLVGNHLQMPSLKLSNEDRLIIEDGLRAARVEAIKPDQKLTTPEPAEELDSPLDLV